MKYWVNYVWHWFNGGADECFGYTTKGSGYYRHLFDTKAEADEFAADIYDFVEAGDVNDDTRVISILPATSIECAAEVFRLFNRQMPDESCYVWKRDNPEQRRKAYMRKAYCALAVYDPDYCDWF